MTDENVDKNQFAIDLAHFLTELQTIDASEGPVAGKHNFYRGADLSVYHDETMEALASHKDKVDVAKCRGIWEQALSSQWEQNPVWIHGDVAQGNLLVKDGRLVGVIDFGILGTGDPACDLVMAWTFFDEEIRSIFKQTLQLDEETWDRAKGWALWKALITYANPLSKKTIHALMSKS